MSVMGGTSVAPLTNAVVVVGHQFLSPYPVDLTVTEKTMSLTDGDYAVTDANGNVFFKVKGKLISLRDKRLLQDASGNTLLTMREKMMSMHRRWQAFRGESSDAKDLLFSVKKSSLLQFKTALDVFLASNTKEEVPDFKIQGSYFERSCTIYNGDASIVIAQQAWEDIFSTEYRHTNGTNTYNGELFDTQMSKRYTAMNIVLGKDAFGVTVYPNVDYAFITALIVMLDEINKDKDGRD